MFITEASLAGKLSHPHIVKVYDAGSEGDMHYIVMEYVQGQTLRHYCKPENLLSVDNIVDIFFKCADALNHACHQGLIHRDIKPANLLMGKDSDIKISDFGTALMTDSVLSEVMDAVGTPSYMSPEQITNKKVNFQTDIYSLGVVMYQLLTGRLPFFGDNQFELSQKVTQYPPPPIERIRSNIPDPVCRIVYRCLEKRPSDRYSSWSALTTELAQLQEQMEDPKERVSDTKKFNHLKRLRFFRNFTDVELWEVLAISKWHHFSAEKTLLKEGKIGGSFFILASGEARITKGSATLGALVQGQCFGEMAYIHGTQRPRSASVVSNSPVLVVKVMADALRKAPDHLQARFNQELLRTLAQRLEATTAMASAL